MLIAVASHSGAQMSSEEWSEYREINPSIASIIRGHDPVGTAALVDGSGLFLAHLDSVYNAHVLGRLSDGRIVHMTLKSSDDATQLAILQADDWIKTARPLAPADDLKSGDRLMAVLPSGLIRAEFVGGRSGLVTKSRRLMPLSEISFEATADRIGGGLVMTRSGELVGFLNAALKPIGEANIQIRPSQMEGDATPMIQRNLVRDSQKAAGPGDMAVAYTPSPRMLRRTMDGLIRGQDVERPSIGVDVKHSPGSDGALIEKVVPGSGADQAGLRVGDIVIEINGQDIDSQMDLAKVVMDQEIGAVLQVKIRRGQSMMTVPVMVGSKPLRKGIRPVGTT